MKIGNSRIMKKIEEYYFDKIKMPSILLMENAALKVVKNIGDEFGKSFVIICGRGNNGGDGLVVARHLIAKGKSVKIFIVGDINRGITHECKINYDIIINMGIGLKSIIMKEDILTLKESLSNCNTVIDCIFGTGISRRVEGIYYDVIKAVNEAYRKVISVDVPSGFDCDSGEIFGTSIKADKTVTFEFYKEGFLKYGAEEYTGTVIVESIGIYEKIIEQYLENNFFIDEYFVKNNFTFKNKFSNKSDYGKVYIFAGSTGFTGAAFICTQAAIKSGSGLVTLCTKHDIQSILSTKLVEAMTLNFEEKNMDVNLKKADCIAFGCGMGNNEETLKLLKDVIEKSTCSLVIDADGLNVLQGKSELIKKYSDERKIIMTPHPGEMARLSGYDIDYINDNRIDVAKTYAKENGVILVLKGYNTIVTDGDKLAVNTTGNKAMAHGGMGDCLTGMIASFVGQGIKPFEAACSAVYIHGYIGDKLAEENYCVAATDVINEISRMLLIFQQF